jgi:hypothetical protein
MCQNSIQIVKTFSYLSIYFIRELKAMGLGWDGFHVSTFDGIGIENFVSSHH